MIKHSPYVRALTGLAISSFACMCFAQWSDVRSLGAGGESTVATDGKGNVYVTAHEPCVIYTSHDFGATFSEKHNFADGFCDVHVYAWPDGKVNLSFIKPNVAGLASYYSLDKGHSFIKGTGIDGAMDREWLAPNFTNGEIYMDYSHGFIGGPKSDGVFLAASTDGGKSFKQRSRVDKEAPEDYPVDPYLATSSDGRIYAMWATSKDFNTIDRFDFAYSTDGGKTFQGHKTLATEHKDLGDTQERWILGAMTSFGEKKLLVVYPDYATIDVDGKTYHPMLHYYRVSEDGGDTFSEPKTVLGTGEIESAMRQLAANTKSDANFPYYIQTLPWACADPYGRFHVAFQENRDGQALIKDTHYDKWHVRLVTMPTTQGAFGPSERVSRDVVCKRPPLDFLSCTADKNRVYVSWTETPNSVVDWPFTGELWTARKIFKAPDGVTN